MIPQCPICTENEADDSFEIVIGRKQKHNLLSVSETTYYQSIPACSRCARLVKSATVLRIIFGISALVALLGLISSYQAFLKNKFLQLFVLSVDPRFALVISALVFVGCACLAVRSWIRRSRLIGSAKNNLSATNIPAHEPFSTTAAKPWHIASEKVCVAGKRVVAVKPSNS